MKYMQQLQHCASRYDRQSVTLPTCSLLAAEGMADPYTGGGPARTVLAGLASSLACLSTLRNAARSRPPVAGPRDIACIVACGDRQALLTMRRCKETMCNQLRFANFSPCAVNAIDQQTTGVCIGCFVIARNLKAAVFGTMLIDFLNQL